MVEVLEVVGVLVVVESAGEFDGFVGVVVEAHVDDSEDAAAGSAAEDALGEPAAGGFADDSVGEPAHDFAGDSASGSAGDSADAMQAGPDYEPGGGPVVENGYAGEEAYGTSSWRRSAGGPVAAVVVEPVAAAGVAEPAVVQGGPGVFDDSDGPDGSDDSGVSGALDVPDGLGVFGGSDAPGEIAAAAAGRAGQVEGPAAGHVAEPAGAWADSWPAGGKPSVPTAVASAAADQRVGGRPPRLTRHVPGSECASSCHWGRSGHR